MAKSGKSRSTLHPYNDIYKGVYKNREMGKKIIWRECLKCNKDFPGGRYIRLCQTCHAGIKAYDQSMYQYELN